MLQIVQDGIPTASPAPEARRVYDLRRRVERALARFRRVESVQARGDRVVSRLPRRGVVVPILDDLPLIGA